jgi:hypothetical protein
MNAAIADQLKKLSNDRSKRFHARAISFVKSVNPNHDSDPKCLRAIATIREHDGTPGGATRNSVIVSLRECVR